PRHVRRGTDARNRWQGRVLHSAEAGLRRAASRRHPAELRADLRNRDGDRESVVGPVCDWPHTAGDCPGQFDVQHPSYPLIGPVTDWPYFFSDALNLSGLDAQPPQSEPDLRWRAMERIR